nr:MAG TPA: hypothetical protein [Caudoviricetes sp.]
MENKKKYGKVYFFCFSCCLGGCRDLLRWSGINCPFCFCRSCYRWDSVCERIRAVFSLSFPVLSVTN